MTNYVIYVDDSGDKDYATSPALYGVGPTRYFVFGGVLATQDAASRLAQEIQDLKEGSFGDPRVEVKSNWLRMPQERQKRYLDPYGITEGDLSSFTDDYYDLINDADIILVAGVVDKLAMQNTYGERAYYPPAIAYELIAQRIQNHIGPAGTCLVVMDDMSGKNPKGSEHKANLVRQHRQMRKSGSQLVKGLHLPALGALRFNNSARSHLIQVADIVGYNVHRQFREHGDAWEQRGLASLPLYDPFKLLLPKFRSSAAGQISGYGVVKMPQGNKIPWGINRKRAVP